jgi:two-component system OmpR family response regulator
VERTPEAADGGLVQVLLVEDDAKFARLTVQYLERQGLVVTWVDTGPQGLQAALRNPYDVVLLDLMLPGMDGSQVCRELRAHRDVPIIMVTARGEEADRVMGLEGGADDYVAKPYSARELLARIRAQVRRRRGRSGPSSRTVQVGALKVNPASMEASVEGRPLTLTSYEFALLKVLAERAGHVLTREQLLELTGGCPDETFDRSIDVRISRLRHKLGDDPRQPRLLKTVRGAGYMLAKDEG